MANYLLPVINTAWKTRIALKDWATPGALKSNPTIAAGDFQVDIDGAGFNNLTNLPSVSPAASVGVLLDLTSSEMNGTVITIACIDQTSPKEWADELIVIPTIPAALSTLDAAGVRSAVGLASANLDTQIGTLATAAALSTVAGYVDTEVAAILAAVDTEVAAIKTVTDAIGATGSGLSAIPWNAAWDAEVQSEATDALNAYDPPTHTEMTSELASADDAVLAAIAALNNLSAAEVNAELLDVLNVDTFAQPGQGTPAATTTLTLMIRYLYKAWRNGIAQTATTYSLYNDDGTTVDQKATVADNGTTFTRSEVVTGP